MAIADAPKQRTAEVLREPLRLERYFTKDGVHPYDEIEWEIRDAVILGETGPVFEQKDVEVPKFWSQTATNVVASKYFRGTLGTPARETSIKQIIDRVAKTIANWGRAGRYFATEEDAEIFEEELTWLLVNQHMAFNSPVWFNVGVYEHPQASACQPYRARVSTPFGLVEIGEIVERNLVGLPVYDANGLTLVTATKHNGRKSVYRVQLANGSFVEATGEHVVSAIAVGLSGARWMRVDELRPGMRLRLKTHRAAILAGARMTEFAEVGVGVPTLVAAGADRADVTAPEPIIRLAEGDVDVSEAALAGWLQADGFVGQHHGTNRSLTIEFQVANGEERAWVLRHLDVVFPNVHRHESPHPRLPDYRKIRLYGNVLKPFVEKYGLRLRGTEIRVPAPLWTAKAEVVRAYLRSVFQADGYVTMHGNQSLVAVAVIGRRWVEDLQLLLLSRGIYSRILHKREKRPDRYDLWEIRIGYLVERAAFRGEIGFISERKQRKLEESLALDGKIKSDESREEIVAIEALGEEDVYDIQTLSGEYLSNNVVVHNCFILSVEDDMESILEWFQTEGRIFKGGSGSGLNVSTLRSAREHLSGGGYASGPVSFMRGADSVAGSIKSGGTTRRAAKMVVLNADHPDVRDFIWCKAKEERKAWALGEAGYDMSLNGEAWQSIQFQNANNSVRATDEFMQAALEGKEWALKAVVGGETLETVNARALLREIAEAAWECGDPGMHFDTTFNDWHTIPNSGRINATNPCSEFATTDNSACNLASLNLMRFLHSDAEFDVEKFRRGVEITITAQEIIVGNASYPTKRIDRNAKAQRQLGMGYANLGAVLMQRGLPYDSDEGRAYSAAITALMTGEAYAQSARIAANPEIGPFEDYPKNREPMLRVIGKHREAAYRIQDDLVPPSLLSAARQAWDDALTLGGVYGYRNAQSSLLAPTGTVSFYLDSDTTGVEPDIALVKYKKLVGGGTLKLVNQTVPVALRRLGYTQTQVDAMTAYIEAQGTIEGAPELNDKHLPIFDCAFKPQNGVRSISHMGHIQMMGAVQPFLSGAISKTVNLPESATVEDVMDAYVEAWRHGVKAVAIYRDGSKKTQPLSTSDQNANEKKKPVETVYVEVAKPVRKRLSDTRASLTHKFSIEGHECYITVGLFEDGRPGELFISIAKEGSTLSGMLDAFARSVSLLLQYGAPLSHLVEKFAHMRFEPSGWTGNPEIGMAKSIVDYVFRWLGLRFLSDEEKAYLGLVRETTPVAEPGAQQALLDRVTTLLPEQPKTNGHTAAVAASERKYNSTPDAPPCPNCGFLMIRNGTCHKCENCGSTSGCS